MASIEPHAKRQRKEPSWRAEFVDPDQVKDGTLIADEDPTAQQLVALQQLGQKQGQGQGQQHKRGSTGPASSASSDEGSDPGTSEEPPRVLDVRPLDANKVEVVVERDGRRYRGVMERKELPHSVGVPVPVSHGRRLLGMEDSHLRVDWGGDGAVKRLPFGLFLAINGVWDITRAVLAGCNVVHVCARICLLGGPSDPDNGPSMPGGADNAGGAREHHGDGGARGERHQLVWPLQHETRVHARQG